MLTWAVANQKGGVGKTTTTVSLAGLLARRGRRVLMVDMDPQCSLTSYFGLERDSLKSNLYGLFKRAADGVPGGEDEAVLRTRFDRLSVIAASPALAALERQLGAREGMGLVLANALKRLASRFDHVLLDCPAMLGVSMINALAACDRLIIPVQTEFLAVNGLERMIETLGMITRAGKRVSYVVVPTLFDRRTRASVECLDLLREHHGTNLWPDVIPVDTRFRDASKSGTPLPLVAAESRGSEAYAALLGFLMGEPPAQPSAKTA